MIKSFLLLTASVALCLPGWAQMPMTPSLSAMGCPVNFSVERKPIGSIIQTDGKQLRRSGQGVQINFHPSDAARIVRASVVVHGLSGRATMLPITQANNKVTQSFDLQRKNGKQLATRELWPKSMAVVESVEITSLEFADGSTWHASDASRCSSSPSLYLPVDNK